MFEMKRRIPLHYRLTHNMIKDSKGWFKYYIPKDLYDLFDAVQIYPPYNCEFYTLHEDYKEIWSKLRIHDDYGYCVLRELGWDDTVGCYVVDVDCPDLIEYVKRFGYTYHCSTSEKNWKQRASSIGWNDEEVEKGYQEYKYRYDRWVESIYGKHIPLRTI